MSLTFFCWSCDSGVHPSVGYGLKITHVCCVDIAFGYLLWSCNQPIQRSPPGIFASLLISAIDWPLCDCYPESSYLPPSLNISFLFTQIRLLSLKLVWLATTSFGFVTILEVPQPTDYWRQPNPFLSQDSGKGNVSLEHPLIEHPATGGHWMESGMPW